MDPGTRLANIGNMPDAQVGSALESAPQNNRGKNRKMAGGVAVALALVSAAGIFVWLGEQRSTSAAEGAAAESTLALETFVVNLNSVNLNGANLNGAGSPRAYLRIGITLGLAHPLPRNQSEAAPTALVRDTILSVLAAAQPEELLKLDGKRQLKEELLKTLQERVPQLAVQNVYFTEFLVQM